MPLSTPGPYRDLVTGRWWWLWGVVLAVGCDGDPEPLGPALQPRAETQTCMVDVGEPPEPPMWLSETGCFDSLPERVPGPDLIPYTVNSPLWTDGALKERYIVVPPDQFVTFTEVGPWELPVGSVIVKNFVLPPGTRGSDVDVPMETRFMIRGEKEWAFFTYEWNEDRTDAKRFDLGGLRRVPLTGDALLDGGVDGGGSDG
ncbi:MAG: hypothetical protein KC416_16815, partial [Myxococcales bacterium]|nr:hypothetical protein [Myxococcales bacterium]